MTALREAARPATACICNGGASGVASGDA